jgi:hypothetical protein
LIGFALLILTLVLVFAFVGGAFLCLVPGKLKTRTVRNIRIALLSCLMGLGLSVAVSWPHLISHKVDIYYWSLLWAIFLIGMIAGLVFAGFLIGCLAIGSALAGASKQAID